MLLDIHDKFIDLEWKQRDRLLHGVQNPSQDNSTSSQWSRLTGDAIVARNRYANVEPFAGNRIKLQVKDGVNDYINASPITLGDRNYIATQGPKDTNLNHFYRMLAADVSEPVVVVMLTQTHEAGKEKCFQYYPLSPEESPLPIPSDPDFNDDFHGQVELLNVVEDPTTGSEIRTLRLSTSTENSSENSEQRHPRQREIRHLLFSGWPDFLVPEGEDRAALVRLIHLSATLNQRGSRKTATTTTTSSQNPATLSPSSSSLLTDQSNPRIVHCSAGVGRSGTFIALDYLLSQMYSGAWEKHASSDDASDSANGDGSQPGKVTGGDAEDDPVADTVDRLRQQRMMMVQGEAQFFFLYEVLRELWPGRKSA
jgi:protein-tyrosine phosphatase